LIFNVPREGVVEVIFFAIQIEGRGVDKSVGKQLLHLPGFGIGE
jgi:hypothetical protein